MADKPSYTSLSGGPGASAGASAAFARFEGQIDSASAWINFSKRTRLALIAGSSFMSMIFSAAALGAPWLYAYEKAPTGASSYQYTTSTWTLTRYGTVTCTNAGSGASDQCTNNGWVTAGGAQKLGGDFSAAMLSLVLIESILLAVTSLRLFCGRSASGLPLGPKVTSHLQWHTGAHGLLALAGSYAFSYFFVGYSPQGQPTNASNPAITTVWYGGGFACAVMTVMLAAWNWGNVGIIVEQDAADFSGNSSGSNASPAGVGIMAHPVPLEHTPAASLPVAASSGVGTSDISVVSGSAYGDAGTTAGTDAGASYQGYNSYQGH